MQNSTSCFSNDVRLAIIEKNAEHVRPWHSRDATIAKIQTEEINVCGVLVLVEGFEPPLYRF